MKMMIRNSNFSDVDKSGYRIENKKNETTFYIYDEIWRYGVNAKQFVKDLNETKSKTIHFRINSPGGSVFEGLTIFNAIKEHSAKTITHIDGLAASIASVIALASDEIIMAKNAFFMIHDPWTIMAGSAKDLRKEADLLDKISGSIIGTYVANSDKSEKEIKSLMADETWFTADEALEAGFISEIFEVEKDGNDEKDSMAQDSLFDLSIFDNVPEKLTMSTKEVEVDTADMNNEDLNPRDLEQALRDAGCSRTQAKTILAKGLDEVKDVRDVQTDPIVPLRDAELAENEEVEEELVVDKVDKIEKVKKVKYDKANELLNRADVLIGNN